MKKTIAEHLGLNRKNNIKPQNKVFYLDDVLDNNPGDYCPFCESSEVRSVNTHNPDGYDYKCNDCNSTYEIFLGNKGEMW